MGPELVILVAGESVQRETICHRKRLRTFRQRKAQAQKENVVPPHRHCKIVRKFLLKKMRFLASQILAQETVKFLIAT